MSQTLRAPLLPFLRAVVVAERALHLGELSLSQIRWAVDNGLGPILRYVTALDAKRETSPGWPLVLSSDLTARILAAEHTEALAEILDYCRDLAPITLLKGAWAGHKLYPSPHLRVMRDLDLLVPESSVPKVEDVLLRLGYQRRQPADEPVPATHHHGVPFWHSESETWVEVHWALVPPQTDLADEVPFRAETLESETQMFSLNGHQAQCFKPELQMIHLASHWARGVAIPGGMIPLVDLALLLKSDAEIDWDLLHAWLGQSPAAAAHLYLALSYVNDAELAVVPRSALSGVRDRQQPLTRSNLAMLHRLIDRHLVGGIPFERPITEPVFRSLWDDLLRPQPGWRNLFRLGRYLLPRRLR